MKKKKLLFIFMIFVCLFTFIPNVNAENFTCSAFGSDVYIDKHLAQITKYVILILQIVAPIILVIMGMIDLMKGITSQKEDEIKKGQQTFIKRAIAAVIVFFVIQIVQLLVGFISNGDPDITQCFNCFVNGKLENGCIDTGKVVDE